MPTPFNHIVLSETLLESGNLPPAVTGLLQASRAAFLLGSTAPDLGTLRGRARAETHFFHVPMRGDGPAHLSLLDRHSELADGSQLGPDHAAFMAGYLTHLWVDQLWIKGIFQPYFAVGGTPLNFRQRLTDHNLLRAHLDRLDRRRLSPYLRSSLESVQPDNWLPFAGDGQILAWRDHLAEQLGPDGHYRTEEVFAQRLGIAPGEFRSELDSAEHMRYILHELLPPAAMKEFRRSSLAHMAELLQYYLEGRVRAAPTTSGPVPTLLVEQSQRTGEDHAHHRTI